MRLAGKAGGYANTRAMGFLSRKNKFKAAPVVEEQHPIVEELEEMEEVLPETPRPAGPVGAGDREPSQPAGPVAAGDPPPPAVAKASSGAVPPTAPPAGEASEVKASQGPGTQAADAEESTSEPERFMPRDLLAPSRHEVAVKEPEVEVDVKHAEVIAFANQKGGVAKTTTTLNLAVAFAESGHRVLCVDLDPQGNLTMSQGIDPDKVEKSLYDVLVHDMPMAEIIQHREIDIAVASIDLAGAEIAMSTKIGRERSLEKSLKEVWADYDFV